MAKAFFKLRSGQGQFWDISQKKFGCPESVVNGQIAELEITQVVLKAKAAMAIVEVTESEYKTYLAENKIETQEDVKDFKKLAQEVGEKAINDAKLIVDNATKEAEKILSDAKAGAELIAKGIVEDAKAQATAILDKANKGAK
jgi:vacuolar-type H+-ATPase subunit H